MGADGSLNFDTKIDSSGFQKGIEGLGGVAAKGLGATVKIMETAAAGVAALGGAAVKVGSDFEAAMSQVQAVSGASGDALDALREKAKEMGAKTKFSATESAEAMNYMAMAGWKTEEMLGGIEGIMNLAAASGEDLATTSDIVTDALTAFGLTASDSGHFADILAAASSNANTNVSLMGETFKYVAPLAGALGYSAEDMATAIGLMANAGVKGSEAGTSLRAMITRLAKPTKESEMAMAALGLSITDSSGKMKPFSEIVGDMRDAFSGLTEDEKASYAAMLGGQEAMSGLLAIVGASDKDFEKLSGAIRDCNGSAEEMAKIMQDNLQGQITILQSGLEGLGVSLYESMQGTAKGVVKEAQGMVQQLQDAFNAGGFDGLVGSIGNVLAQIVQRIAEATPMVIEGAVNLVTSFCEGLKNAPGLAESGANLIGSLISGILSCMGQIGSTAVVLFTQLLAGLAQELPQIITTGKEAVGKFVSALVDNAPSILSSGATIISTLFNALMEALPEITGAGVEVLNKLAQGISENLPTLIPAAMDALVQFSGSLRENVGQLVDAGLNLIMALAQSLTDNIPVFIETIPTIITNIAGIINDNAPKLLASGLELIVKLGMGLIQAIPTLIANIPQIIQAVVEVFTAFNWLSLGKNIITFIVDGVRSLATSIPEALRNIGQTAVNWLRGVNWRELGSNLITMIVNGIRSLVTAIPEMLRSIGGRAVEFFRGINWPDLGVNLIKGIISGITGALGGLWDAVKNVGTGILDGIKSFFGINSPSTVMAEQGGYLVQGLVDGIANMPAELGQFLDQSIQKVVAFGQQMLSDVQVGMVNMVSTAATIVAELPGKMWECFANVVTKAIQWGQQMLATATGAISSMISGIISLLSELPGKVWAWLVDVVTKVASWGHQILTAAQAAANNMVSSVISLISALPGKFATYLTGAASKVASWAGELATKGAAAAKGLFDAVVNGVKGLPDKMKEVGSNIVSGVWNGISSGWNWLKEQVSNVANSLLDAAKDALGVESPSKEFRDEFGRWLMPGTVEGIEKSMPQALKDMKAQAGELLAAMQGTIDASMGRVALNVSGANAGALAGGAGTVVYNDNTMRQENIYQVPVVSPSETARANREAFRKMAGGVK